MNLSLRWSLALALAGGLLAASSPSAEAAETAETNASSAGTVSPLTRADLDRGYLQIQEQIHATQLEIEKAQLSTAVLAKNNSEALAIRLQSLEQSLATLNSSRAAEAEAARKTQQWTLFMAGLFGLAGLGVMLVMVYFQWRAIAQLAAARPPADGGLVHQLAAPGQAEVQQSRAQLLGTIRQLETRVHELEAGRNLLPGDGADATAGPLGDVQQRLDANQPQMALEILEQFLPMYPQHAGALAKKAVALEKLGRTDEALACCDRAIEADPALAVAHLHKGAILNRLRRYDEALACYEKALAAQGKKNGLG